MNLARGLSKSTGRIAVQLYDATKKQCFYILQLSRRLLWNPKYGSALYSYRLRVGNPPVE
eukprot:IDg5695t1